LNSIKRPTSIAHLGIWPAQRATVTDAEANELEDVKAGFSQRLLIENLGPWQALEGGLIRGQLCLE
jgi:hypothetical protein